MFRGSPRGCGQLVAAIAAAALALPATAPAYQDFRNPDNRDNGVQTQQRGTTEAPPPPEIAKAPAFDWGDAAIGAGSALGLVLIVLSGALAVVHRRSRRADDRPVAS